ncbi:Ribokinase-like protein [Mycena floridula]|nr:Ribokinase-like protein [Mycena floridula]
MSRCLVRGSINIDEFFHVKDIVRPGETISSSGLDKRPGGKGANQAVAVARAGSSVDLVGAVGSDGESVVSFLKSAGVNVEQVVVDKVPSGRAIIQLSEEGENSIILFKGANYATLRDTALTIHPDTTHLLLQNEIDPAETVAWLSAASSSNDRKISSIFNPSPMPSDAELKAFPWDQLTWLIVNEGEASDLYKVLSSSSVVPRTADLGSELPNLSAYPVLLALAPLIPKTNIICTLGGNGVLALVPSIGDSESPIYVPAAKCDVRDTTGAGDCFAGYMVSGLMQTQKEHASLTRQDVLTVLKRCVKAAGLCVEKRGAMESIPSWKELKERFLSSD